MREKERQSDETASRLAEVDLGRKIRRADSYEAQKRQLQKKMLQIQQAYLRHGQRAVVVLEGWDAAGKGGAIRRLTQGLDPRGYKVWPIAQPTPRERDIHYLYRFWQRLPEPGTIAIFDRSWYGRVLVERVEALVEPAVWARAYREIDEFERMLVDDGIRLVKLFFHVSAGTQLDRLRERLKKPYKRWKVTADDFRNLALRQAYAAAIEEMLERTSTRRAPWHVVPSEHKWYARIEAMRIVAEAISAGIDLSPPAVAPELLRALHEAEERLAEEE